MHTKLTDLCEIQYGYAFDSKKFSEDRHYIPLIRIRDVKRGFSETFYSGEYSDEYIVRKDDLLIGMDGEFNIARWQSCDALLNQRVCKITAKIGVCEEFLRFALAKELKKIEDRTAFVTVKHLSAKELNKLELEIPDYDIQEKISESLNRIEEIISKRKQQLAKLDELVKARFVEMFGDIASCPKYDGVTLGTICTTLSGGTPTTKVPEYYAGDIPWLSTPYLGNNHINGSSAKAYITEDAIKNSATHLIPANTILFGIRVGVGKSSIIDEPMCANQDIVALMGIDKSKYNLLFIKHVLDAYQSHFDSIKKGATILGITTEDLKKVLVPTVDVEIQNQFATFVEQVDKSKFAVQKALDEAQTLFDSLMQQYFG